MIIFTDGISNDQALTIMESNNAKQKGIHLIAVGIGKGIDETELTAIDNSFTSADSFEQAKWITKKEKQIACSIPHEEILPLIHNKLKRNYVTYYKLVIPGTGITLLNKIYKGNISIYYSFKYKTPSEALNDGRIIGTTFILPDADAIRKFQVRFNLIKAGNNLDWFFDF